MNIHDDYPRGIFCRICFPDEKDDAHLGRSARLVRVWVSGDNNLLNLSSDGYPFDATWELDGKTSKRSKYPNFVSRPTMRGSIINILFTGEACNHYWVKQIHFHKGDVTEEIFGLDGEGIGLDEFFWGEDKSLNEKLSKDEFHPNSNFVTKYPLDGMWRD